MRSLEKQLDKSLHTDGSGPALFSLFVRRVKENMHLVLAMSPFGDAFRRSIARFPALLNCYTINWVHQWPDDALNFVSNKFLKGVGFGGAQDDDDDDDVPEGVQIEAGAGGPAGVDESGEKEKQVKKTV